MDTNYDNVLISGKKIYTDGKGKLFFGYERTDNSVVLVDYKTWVDLDMKDISNEHMKGRLMDSILARHSQLRDKVEYNIWYKTTNPTFVDSMNWFIKNSWFTNITRVGIKG